MLFLPIPKYKSPNNTYTVHTKLLILNMSSQRLSLYLHYIQKIYIITTLSDFTRHCWEPFCLFQYVPEFSWQLNGLQL